MPTYLRTADTPASVFDKLNDHTVVMPGQSIETYKILVEGWSKTSDQPYFPIATLSQTVTSPATVSNLLSQRVIRVVPGADGLSMTANVAGNPNAYPLTKGMPMDILNDGEIEALVFTGSGSVTVIGLPE